METPILRHYLADLVNLGVLADDDGLLVRIAAGGAYAVVHLNPQSTACMNDDATTRTVGELVDLLEDQKPLPCQCLWFNQDPDTWHAGIPAGVRDQVAWYATASRHADRGLAFTNECLVKQPPDANDPVVNRACARVRDSLLRQANALAADDVHQNILTSDISAGCHQHTGWRLSTPVELAETPWEEGRYGRDTPLPLPRLRRDGSDPEGMAAARLPHVWVLVLLTEHTDQRILASCDVATHGSARIGDRYLLRLPTAIAVNAALFADDVLGEDDDYQAADVVAAVPLVRDLGLTLEEAVVGLTAAMIA